MIPFKNSKLPEAMPLILKAIQTVVSGLLRLKLQIRWDPFSKLTYLLLFCAWFRFDSLGLFLSSHFITVDWPIEKSCHFLILKYLSISIDCL